MATKKISELDPAAALTGDELVEIVQDGANVRTTTQDIADLGGGGGGALTVTGQTASYTAVLADANGYVRMNVAGANTFTVPANASVAFPTGTRLYVEQRGAGTTTITPDTGVTILSRGSVFDTGGQYAVAVLVKVDTDIWVLSGDIA